MKTRNVLVVIFLLIVQVSFGQIHRLVKKWESDTLLKTPESVLFDAPNHALYVANIDGEPWGKDGKGSIGKLGLDGKIIAIDWVAGLDAPKGMGIYKGKLYVADLSNVVVIDIAKGTIDRKIPVETAQGLNDVTIDGKGVVYVSDSKVKKVFKIENDKASLFLDSLKGPNGLLVHGNDICLLDAGGMYRIGNDKKLIMVAEGMEGGTDGIENVQGKDYLVSCWAGVIWYVNANGTKEKLLDTREEKKNTADIGFDPKTKTVYVPTFFKNSVVAYEVK